MKHSLSKLKQTFGIMLLGTLLVITSILMAAEPRYWVYCANDKIEVAMWDLEQMKVRRGSNVYLLGQFNSHSDAIELASRFGGNGAPCGKK